MKKLFIVSVDDATKEQRNAFTSALRTKHKGCGFWHHIENTWIIIDPTGELKASPLSDEILSLMPKATIMVLQAKPLDYSAYAPVAGHKWLEALESEDWT